MPAGVLVARAFVLRCIFYVYILLVVEEFKYCVEIAAHLKLHGTERNETMPELPLPESPLQMPPAARS